MSTPGVQTFLGAAGACPEISYQGKVWKVGHPTQRAKATLEDLAVARAVSNIRKLRNSLKPDEYKELFEELTASIGAGHYQTWGKEWVNIVLIGRGTDLFFLSLLRENHPDASESDALALMLNEKEQVGAAIARVVPGFLSMLYSEIPLDDEKKAKMAEVLRKLQLQMSGLTSDSPQPKPSRPTSGD